MGGSRQAGEEGHFGSGQLQVRFHFCPQTPSPDSSTGSLYSSTSESVSKESDILAPCGEFPQEVAWKLLPGPWEGAGEVSSCPCPHRQPVPRPLAASPPGVVPQPQWGVRRSGPPTHCDTSGKSFPALGLSVSICKMGVDGSGSNFLGAHETP